MKKLIMVAVATLMLSLVASAASTANGTLTVTAVVENSMSLTFEQASTNPATLVGKGTNLATLDFGTISYYGTLTNGTVTRSLNPGSFDVDANFAIQVKGANLIDNVYTLDATLTEGGGSLPGVTWYLDGTNLGGAYSKPNQPLGVAKDHTLRLRVPVSAGSGNVSGDIAFLATAN